MTEDMNRREFIGRSTTSTVGLAAGLAILTDADPAGAGEPERSIAEVEEDVVAAKA